MATGLATSAQASGDIIDAGGHLGLDPLIVVTDDIDLDASPPGGALDDLVDVTGVGQMVVDAGGGFVGLCSGTLINPRTVIFAAHCVNDEPDENYGAASGGTPISFGFSANNRPALRRWLGLDGGTLHATDTAAALYNVEQIWYDERSLELGFLEADVALATLDTHAGDVPTWVMLFSPLKEETHAIINGYGARGVGADGANLGIDFRRRIAENTLSVLGSLEDRNDFLFGADDYGLPQNLYMTDFDSPGGVTDPDYGFLGLGYDFDVFNGPALPNEGTTAGGDSGGPLIVDEKFEVPVVVGVLSGGSRFFADQPFSSYGTHSFYQPLFMFWESIVANNPYAYVSALPGDANWNDRSHWIQDMDPAYQISDGRILKNALPGFAEAGVSGETPQFGEVCFLDDCYDLANESVTLASTGPNTIYVPGGPGTTDFVPNNRVADPAKGVKARYYDVTLSAVGTTTLHNRRTIDRLTVGGLAGLKITRPGNLKVWGDYMQQGGTVSVDGQLTTGEAFIDIFGILSGRGRIDPTYLTVLRGVIVPGEIDQVGKLTIQGDVILSSGAISVFNLERGRSDVLAVTGDSDNPGAISLGGLAAFVPGAVNGPRFGGKYTVVTAEGGVQDTFDEVFWAGLGVLYPELTYKANSVVAELKAGSFASYLADAGVANSYALAFGNAFDALRTTSYADLTDVFGAIDVMGVADLANTFGSNSAAVAGDLAVSDERQNGFVRRLVSDRLSLMGRPGSGGTMQIVGGAAGFGAETIDRSGASQLSFASSYQQREMAGMALPENVSGFVSSGYRRVNDTGQGASGRDESGTWHMALGMEVALDERNAVGSAFAHSTGQRQIGGTLARINTSHAAFYGAHQLGGGTYVGGQVSLAHSALDAAGNTPSTGAGLSLDSQATSYAGEVELGYNHALGDLTLTPRTRLEYAAHAIEGFQDRRSQLNMAVDGIERSGLDWRAGLRLAGSTRLGTTGWMVQPQMQLDYVRRLSGNDTRIDLRFIEANGVGISVPVALHDGEYGELRGGVTLTDGRLSFGAAVEKQMGQDLYRDDRGVVSVSYAF